MSDSIPAISHGRLGPRGHVYAFEPEPRNIERLTKNVELNPSLPTYVRHGARKELE